MSVKDQRRAEVLEKIADYMLHAGLKPASLRALAAATGTSDRMLLYYFRDKDELIEAALHTITARLRLRLAVALPANSPMSPNRLLGTLAPILRGAEIRPYMQLWLELAILAARGEEPFRKIGGQIADGFLAMAAARLDAPDEATRIGLAARLLATLDGALLMDLLGRGAIADQALLER